MANLLFRRTAAGDQYPINLSAILNPGQRVWDPSYSLSEDPEIWEKVQQVALIAGAIERNLMDIAGIDWELKPQGDSDADKRLADILTDLLRQIPQFPQARKNLAEAKFLGSSFAWMTGTFRRARAGEKVRKWWVPGRLIDIDRRRLRAIANREPGDRGYTFRWELHSTSRRQWEPIDFDRQPMIRCVHNDRESSLGYGKGLLDSIYRAFWAWTEVDELGLQGLGRWAQGLLIGKVDPDALGDETQTNEDIRDALKSVLLETAKDNVAILDGREEVEVHTGGSEGYQMVQQAYERIERWLVTRIEGTPLATMDGSQGGAYALASEQGDQQHNRVAWDRKAHAEDLDQLVEYAYVMNQRALYEEDPRLLDVEVPRFGIIAKRDPDPVAQGQVIQVAQQVGIQIPKKWAHEQLGIPMPEPDEELLEAPQMGMDMFGGEMAAEAKDRSGPSDWRDKDWYHRPVKKPVRDWVKPSK